MGIKKARRRLVKLGRKASTVLGKGGKKWVEAVFETASGILEDEIRKKKNEKSKKRPDTGRSQKAAPRAAAQSRAAQSAKKGGKGEKKRSVAKAAHRPTAARRDLARAEPLGEPSAATSSHLDDLEGQPRREH